MIPRRLLLTFAAAAALFPIVARADIVDDIKKRGELIVGMEVAFKPYEYFQDGKIVGYDCDIAERLGKTLGVKVHFVDTAWNGIIPALYTKKFDIIMSGMAMTKERAERVQFSMPYSESGPVILKRADDTTINGPEDLSGKAVGTQLGSSTEPVVKAEDAKLKAEGKRGFTSSKLYDHFPEAYIDLANKRIDAVLIGRIPAMVLIQSQPGKFALGGSMGVASYTGFAMRKDDQDLARIVNQVLAEMKADGSLKALQVKWIGAPIDTPNQIPANLP